MTEQNQIKTFMTQDLSPAEYKTQSSIYNHSESNWTIYHFLTALFLGGGLLASVFGMFVILIYALVSRTDDNLNYVGTALMIAAIPTLMLGAHFMDKLEDQERQHRKTEVEKALQRNAEPSR